MRKALFPISVDNRRFTSAFYSRVLKASIGQYEEIVFLIADKLQLYNLAAEVKFDTSLKGILNKFTAKNYFEQKRNWLRKLKRAVGGNTEWKFKSISDVTDDKFYEIYRSIILAFHTNSEFRSDIVANAARFLARKQVKNAPQVEQRLSEAYILEEIAVNIRLRVLDNITHEYYPFGYFKPMMKVYSDCYGFNAFEIAGVSPYNEKFGFFQWNETNAAWESVPF